MFTANGKPVIALRLSLPLFGAWTASFELDSEEALTGQVTIAQSDTDVSYVGYVLKSGVVAGSCFSTVIGGKAGGLALACTARSYQNATAKTVASELLANVGETLDTSSSKAPLATLLPFWTRAVERSASALTALATAIGAVWRIMPAGSVWVGADRWPVSTLQALELNRDPESDLVVVDMDTIGLVPGVMLNGDRVGRVEHSFGRNEDVKTTYWVAS